MIKKITFNTIYFIKKFYYKNFSIFFDGDIKLLNRHKTYKEYVKKQIEKTKDPNRIKKWKGNEWKTKVLGFQSLFKRNKIYLKNKKKAICLGSRTGQEVFVLRELGIDTIGVDLVSFPPYTIMGDIHNLNFPNKKFDLCFTNIFDHSLYPKKFVSEIERICQKDAIIIINLQVKKPTDEYSENIVNNVLTVIKMFKNSKLILSRSINNTFDEMNHELILKKI